MKKITVIELTTALLALFALGIYFLPNMINKKEDMILAKIKSDNAIFTSKVLELFAKNPNQKPSQIAQTVLDELNTISKNPYDKNLKAYTFEKDCKGCSSVEYDDKLIMVIVTTYDKKGDLIARTVIKPPSFVTYLKSDEDSKK